MKESLQAHFSFSRTLRVILFAVLSAALSPSVVAEETQKWHARTDVLYKAGDSRQIGQLGFTLPLDQTDDALLFLDFRGRIDDQDTEEFNLGLAYRKIISNDWIFGAYGFFDRHTSGFGNQFDQGTVGFEFLSEDWDFRVNGYLPDLNGQDIGGAGGGGFGSLTVVGDQFFINTLQFEERAYYGGDYEVGKRLAVFGENDHEVRVFGGGYYFDNDSPGYAHIAGARVRLETRLFDLAFLGEGSRVTLSGEVQWDRVRETQGFGGLAVQIPLGRWEKGGPVGGVGSSYGGLSALERRMLDPILRDIDIVTQSQQSGSTSELALDAEGDAMFLADAGHSIDGAIEKAGQNGTVVVSGTVETESAQLQQGQRLISATSTQTVVGQESGIRVSGPLPGSQGVIRGTSTLSHVVALNNGVTVDGLHIEGGNVGLFAYSVQGVVLQNNVVSGAQASGLEVTGSFNGRISQNRFSTDPNHSGYGVMMGQNLGLIEDNVFHDNDEDGLQLSRNLGTIRGNEATGNGNGFVVEENDGLIEDNIASSNGSSGFRTANNRGTFRNNRAFGQGINGFSIADNDGLVEGNQSYDNGQRGFDFRNNFGEVRGNTASRNLQLGFHFRENDGLVIGNTADGSGFSGFQVATINRGTIRSNRAFGSIEHGIMIEENDTTGVVAGNIANNNGLSGFWLPNNRGSVAGNTANGNTSHGFTIIANNGEITGNTAAGNHFYGFSFSTNNRLVSQNSASGNGNNGFNFSTNNDRVTENTSNGNTGTGFNVVNNNSLVNGNTADGNTAQGINMFDNNGTISGNEASGNTLAGMNIFDNNPTGVVSGNTMRNNLQDGFTILTNFAGGVIRDNVSLTNGSRGYNIFTNNGTLLNNTGAGNVFGFDTAP